MKVVCVLGSPRMDGVSAAIAREFCEAASALGAQVETFALNRLKYRGCQGCLACKTRLERCALADDLTAVLRAASEADVLVVASSIFLGDVTSQLKGFLDRCFSYLKPDYLTNPVPHRLEPGKRLVFVLAQGFPEQMHGDVFPRYAGHLRWLGFDEAHLIRASVAASAQDPAAQEGWLRLARETAAKVCRAAN